MNFELDPVARFYASVQEEELFYEDIEDVFARVSELVHGQTVLELAWDSGRLTEAIEPSAASATLHRLDGPRLPDDLGNVSCVCAGFVWSHLTRDQQDAMLARLRKVGKDVLLVLVDDAWVEGESAPIARTDAQGNTYQILTTPDGERIEIPKNYPSDSALRKRLAPACREIRIERFDHYWLATARLK